MGKSLREDREIISKAFKDERVLSLCFCRENQDEDLFLTSKESIYKYFNGIMQTTFFFVYGRYKQWETTERYIDYSKERGTKNFNRIVRVLEGLYEKRSLTHSIISEILTDIQIDIAFSQQGYKDDISLYQSLNDLFLKNDIELNNHDFAECDYLARLYIGSGDVKENLKDIDASHTLQERRDNIIQLVSNTFPFFQFLSAKEKEIQKLQLCDRTGPEPKFPFVNDLKELGFIYDGRPPSPDRKPFELSSDISTKFSLICDRKRDYYLKDLSYDKDSNGESYFVLNYSDYENFRREEMKKTIYVFSSDTPDEDIPDGQYFIRDSNLRDDLNDYFFKGDNRAEKHVKLLDDFSTINYKYIRVLSLSIADVIDEVQVRRLFNIYGRKYPKIFNDANGNGRLDEEEITDIDWESCLAVLLIEESAINVLKNILFWNFKNNQKIHLDLGKNLQTRLGVDKFNTDLIYKACEDEAKLVHKKWTESSRIDSISNELKNEFLDESAFIKAGIYSYHIVAALMKISDGETKLKKQYMFPASIKARSIWLKEINKITNLSKRIESLKTLINQTIIHLICFYEGFCKYVSVKKNFVFYHGDDDKVKAQHLTNEAFKITYEKTFNELKNNSGDIHFLIERIKRFNDECSYSKHFVADKNYFVRNFLGRSELFKLKFFKPLAGIDSVEDENGYQNLFNAVQTFFDYLSPGKTNDETFNAKALAIYPYIATCVFEQETKDGYVIYNFDINDFGNDFTVRVLTEFKCLPNHLYYCLPNTLRYNEDINIWIEPILIDTEKFDTEGY